MHNPTRDSVKGPIDTKIEHIQNGLGILESDVIRLSDRLDSVLADKGIAKVDDGPDSIGTCPLDTELATIEHKVAHIRELLDRVIVNLQL